MDMENKKYYFLLSEKEIGDLLTCLAYVRETVKDNRIREVYSKGKCAIVPEFAIETASNLKWNLFEQLKLIKANSTKLR